MYVHVCMSYIVHINFTCELDKQKAFIAHSSVSGGVAMATIQQVLL